MGVWRYKSRTFLYVIANLKEGQTWGLDIASLNLPTHLTTYIRGTCKTWGIPTLQSSVYCKTLDRETHAVRPFWTASNNNWLKEFYIYFCYDRSKKDGATPWSPRSRQIPSGRYTVGVCSYKSVTFLCVNVCLWRGSHLGLEISSLKHPKRHNYIVAHASFRGIPTLWSLVYFKTLYNRIRMVYTFDRPLTMVAWWMFILVFVRLDHKNMEQHLGAQDLLWVNLYEGSWQTPSICRGFY
jgi:hypothetical protein